MTRILTILILIVINVQAFGQVNKKHDSNKKDKLIQQTDKINSLLKYYSTLRPFSDDEKDIGLIDSISNEITNRLLNVLNDKRILNYQIENLLTEDELLITKSDDNKIYLFSIDEKTGGSYRSNITIIHYRLPEDGVKANLFNGDASELLATSSYGKIFLLDSLDQKYFVTGGVQTCNTCSASLAITIKIDTSSYFIELIALYDGRYEDLKVFDYDSIEKVFYYEYNAADNEDSVYGGDNRYEQLQHKYKSKFKFIKGEFIEIEKCELWDKKD